MGHREILAGPRCWTCRWQILDEPWRRMFVLQASLEWWPADVEAFCAHAALDCPCAAVLQVMLHEPYAVECLANALPKRRPVNGVQLQAALVTMLEEVARLRREEPDIYKVALTPLMASGAGRVLGVQNTCAALGLLQPAHTGRLAPGTSLLVLGTGEGNCWVLQPGPSVVAQLDEARRGLPSSWAPMQPSQGRQAIITVEWLKETREVIARLPTWCRSGPRAKYLPQRLLWKVALCREGFAKRRVPTAVEASPVWRDLLRERSCLCGPDKPQLMQLLYKVPRGEFLFPHLHPAALSMWACLFHSEQTSQNVERWSALAGRLSTFLGAAGPIGPRQAAWSQRAACPRAPSRRSANRQRGAVEARKAKPRGSVWERQGGRRSGDTERDRHERERERERERARERERERERGSTHHGHTLT